MRTSAVALLLASLAMPGCGSQSSTTAATAPPAAAATAPQPAASAPAADAGPERVALGASQYGQVLFDGRQRALYTFTSDGRGGSRCSGKCARAWPPFLVKAPPRAGTGVDAALVGTRRRADGTLQVTYDGRPLYRWYGDPPSKVLCAGVNEFGGGWYAVSSRGRPRG